VRAVASGTLSRPRNSRILDGEKGRSHTIGRHGACGEIFGPLVSVFGSAISPAIAAFAGSLAHLGQRSGGDRLDLVFRNGIVAAGCNDRDGDRFLAASMPSALVGAKRLRPHQLAVGTGRPSTSIAGPNARSTRKAKKSRYDGCQRREFGTGLERRHDLRSDALEDHLEAATNGPCGVQGLKGARCNSAEMASTFWWTIGSFTQRAPGAAKRSPPGAICRPDGGRPLPGCQRIGLDVEAIDLGGFRSTSGGRCGGFAT